MANPTSNGEAIENPDKDEGPVKALLRLTETAAFLRTTDDCFYARVAVAGRREIHALKSAAFRSRLIDRLPGNCAASPPNSACIASPWISRETGINL